MSIKSKLKAREERRKEKRQRKAQQQAKYEAWKQAGINSKSKRSQKRKGVSQVKHTHPNGFCGNPACKLCFNIAVVKYPAASIIPSYFRRHHISI